MPRMLVDQAATALAQTSGFSRDERHAIITLVSEQAIRDHAVDDALSAVLGQMGARDFEWPEFDRWQTLFERRGAFPPLWDGLEQRPRRGASLPVQEAYQMRKLYLLIDWLHALVATRAEMRAALTRYTVRGLHAQIRRQTAGITCPACDPLNHENVPHGSREVPPFHPGCRCLILASHPTAPLPHGKTNGAATRS